MNDTDKNFRTIMGKVVSDRMDKTIAISTTRTIPHPKYKKYIKRHTKYFVHDPENKAKLGDIAIARASRPISKKKHWSLVQIVENTD